MYIPAVILIDLPSYVGEFLHLEVDMMAEVDSWATVMVIYSFSIYFDTALTFTNH